MRGGDIQGASRPALALRQCTEETEGPSWAPPHRTTLGGHTSRHSYGPRAPPRRPAQGPEQLLGSGPA